MANILYAVAGFFIGLFMANSILPTPGDMNNDGKLTLQDLSILAYRIQNQ